ncbi:MAG: hypothetical protein ACOCQR_03580 [bacterium]
MKKETLSQHVQYFNNTVLNNIAIDLDENEWSELKFETLMVGIESFDSNIKKNREKQEAIKKIAEERRMAFKEEYLKSIQN